MSAPPPFRLLFVCYANACRSQMAEGFARAMAPEGVQVQSAGVVAAGLLPETVEAMREVGIDISAQRSKSLDELDLSSFDLIVSLSEQARGRLERVRPKLPLLHRAVLDPVGLRGTHGEIRRMYAMTRDDVQEVVREVLGRVEILRKRSEPGRSPSR